MLITAWYLNTQVQLKVADNHLVYDGNTFVSPATAKYVALNLPTQVQVTPTPKPIQELPLGETFLMNTLYLCEVISVSSTAEATSDVVAAVDPLNGACLCGITCFGPKIFYVVITKV